jgi:hypothetical protein
MEVGHDIVVVGRLREDEEVVRAAAGDPVGARTTS